MVKKVEVFKIGNDGIPRELSERLIVPSHIKNSGHILLPYVRRELIPPNLDLVVVEDLNGFYQRLIGNSFTFLSRLRGLYIAEGHTWQPKKDYQKILKKIKQEYDIEVKRAILLPQERIDYWTLVHEALHDLFNLLPLGYKEEIRRSATQSYDHSEKLSAMLELTHLNISNFYWDLDEIVRRMEKNKKMGRSPHLGFEDFYVFEKLKQGNQYRVVDEFISNFFATDRGRNRWDTSCLAPSFKDTLASIGYNLDHPPAVHY